MLCSCGNHARYVDEDGRLTCGVCPLRAGKDSILLADAARLLKWARGVVGPSGPKDVVMGEVVLRTQGLSDLRSIIGRKL